MYNFTDLIARSYLQHTKEKDDNIAFFFQENYQFIPKTNDNYKMPAEQFYRKVILKIDNLIEDQYLKIERIPEGNRYINEEEEYYAMEQAEERRYECERDEATYMLYLEEIGETYIPPTPINWEDCNDALRLTEAINNGTVLKDPITIISTNIEIQADDLVLRKSKLEYLKAEAIRARDTNSIDGLSEVIELNKNISVKSVDLSVYNLDYIADIVKDRFKFTLEADDRKKVPMLSNDEYLQLVGWVTFFFKNNYELPIIDKPIVGKNIGKTRIRFAFKNLFQFCHPRQPLPKSFYTLVPFCFYALKDDTEATMQKTSDPDKDL
jgi:hypothetical protein